MLIAQLTAVVGNTSFRGFAEPQTAQAFLLTRGAGAKPERKPRLTKKRREETAKNWFQGLTKLMKKQNGE